MNNEKIELRLATADDYESYYSIRAEELNLFWTGYEKAPDYEAFSNWYESRLDDENRHLYLFFSNQTCIGSLNIDFYDDHAFIGYSVIEAFTGKGFGTYLVKNALQIIDGTKKIKIVKAWINFQNIGSIKVIEKNGFTKSNVSEFRTRFGNKEEYLLYTLKL